MSLSSELVSQFVQITQDKPEKQKESTVYGTVVEYDGSKYVKLDGSDLLTPVKSTADIKEDDRVSVMIKNHTATVTGNLTSPSNTVDNGDGGRVSLDSKISEFGILIADRVTTEQLNATNANITNLVADNAVIKGKISASEADISNIQADNVTIHETLTAQEAKIDTISTNKIDASVVEATYATIENLTATSVKVDNISGDLADFKELTTDELTATKANINTLQTEKLSANAAELKYATITNLNATIADVESISGDLADFKTLTADNLTAVQADIDDLTANKLSVADAAIEYAQIDLANIATADISEAAIEKLFTESGIIKELVMSDGHVTGELVGVTIKGDLIEAGTIKADKLIIKDSNDGLYYQLNLEAGAVEGVTLTEEQLQNGLCGTVILANTITAEKINVDDLVAFDATIGGFNITDHTIYSGVKSTIDSNATGIILSDDGQINFGTSNNYVKLYKDSDVYKLAISADTILFGSSNMSVETAINDISSATNNNSTDLSNYISTNNAAIENLQGQIDGSITTWFYDYVPTDSNIPASEWTTTDAKNIHLGDLFYDTITGYCYRWQVKNNVYSWSRITDVDVTKALSDAATAQDTADSKRRVFTETPTPPYEVGDLWVQGTSGDLMRCQTPKTAEQTYSSVDWVKATKYTDDSVANQAKSAADAAQEYAESVNDDVVSLTSRVTNAETTIQSNSDAILLAATKTELAEVDGKFADYSTTAEMESAIEIKADSITSSVASTYTTKTEFNNLTIGGRNLIKNSDVMVTADENTCATAFSCVLVDGIDVNDTFLNKSTVFSYDVNSPGAREAKIHELIIYGKSTQNGTPTPENPVEIVSLDTSSATFTVNDTTIALPVVDEFGGIPVGSGGTYTDANGQQWLCDYIDITAKQFVKQTAEMTVDGSGSWLALSANANVRYTKVLTKKSPSNCVVCDSYLCDTSTSVNMADNTIKFGFPTVESSWIYIHNTAYSTVGEFQAALNANPIKVRYALPEPIITPLTDEQIEAFKDLYTSDGTTISNSMGADMHVSTDNRFGIHGTIVWKDSSGVNSNTTEYPFVSYLSSSITSERVSQKFTFTPPEGYDTINSLTFSVQVNAKPASGNTNVWKIGQPKLEIGTKATDWTPAPEDANADIAALETRVTNTETSIEQTDEQITLLATKTEVTEAVNVVDNKFADYSTTEQMNTAIRLNTDSFQTIVKLTYTTQADFNDGMEANVDRLTDLTTSTDTRITAAESQINQLSNSISTLVRDANGESLMEQTADGWMFSMGETLSQMQQTASDLEELDSSVSTQNGEITSLKESVTSLESLNSYVQITTHDDEPCIELGNTESTFKVRITNTNIQFIDGTTVPAYVTNEALKIDKAEVEDELVFGGFAFKKRANGNMGLIWKGDDE